MKTDYYNRVLRTFIISLFAGVLSLIIWLISPPLPEGLEYTFIPVPLMSGIIVTFFWLGWHKIKNKSEEDDLSTGIISICGALILLAMMVIFNI